MRTAETQPCLGRPYFNPWIPNHESDSDSSNTMAPPDWFRLMRVRASNQSRQGPQGSLMLERQQLEVFHSQSDDSVVIQCHGWMGADTCKDLLRVLEAAFERRVQRLRLDLCHVRGIDEAGIDCVLRTAQRCRQVG